MSNRYFSLNNPDEHMLRHRLLPHKGAGAAAASHTQHDAKSKQVKDEAEVAKRIEGNIHFRNHLLAMQQAKNYHMERDRLHGMIAEHRIPSNRELVRKRIKHLDDKLTEISKK